MVQFDLLPCPPWQIPGDLQFFSFLVVYSPPPGHAKGDNSPPRARDRPHVRFGGTFF